MLLLGHGLHGGRGRGGAERERAVSLYVLAAVVACSLGWMRWHILKVLPVGAWAFAWAEVSMEKRQGHRNGKAMEKRCAPACSSGNYSHTQEELRNHASGQWPLCVHHQACVLIAAVAWLCTTLTEPLSRSHPQLKVQINLCPHQ